MDEDERQPSLDDLLDALNNRRVPRAFDFPALSALSRELTDNVRTGYERLHDEQRRQFMVRLRDIAIDNAEYEFSSVLRFGLDDPDEETRLAALEGLLDNHERWFLRRLLELLSDDPSLAVRIEATQNLGRFVVLAEFDDLPASDANRLRTALRARLDDEGESADLRRAALEALGADSSDDTQERIRQAWDQGDRQLQLGALAAMGRSCSDEWLPILTRELDADDPEFRFESAVALGRIGNPDTSIHLIDALEDEDSDVQLAAVTALGQIGGAMAIKQLTELTRSDDEAIRLAAEDALEEAQFNADPLGFSPN